jgi:hypothetical protein
MFNNHKKFINKIFMNKIKDIDVNKTINQFIC